MWRHIRRSIIVRAAGGDLQRYATITTSLQDLGICSGSATIGPGNAVYVNVQTHGSASLHTVHTAQGVWTYGYTMAGLTS